MWKHAIISLCSWHAKHALMKYLGEHNQSVFVVQHPPLEYKDLNRERGWDADFLDTSWIFPLNQHAESIFRQTMKAKHPQLEDDALENRIRELGKKKQICITEKTNRNEIINLLMLHLQWHPFTHLGLSSKEELSDFNCRGVWMDQITEMHELCRKLGESWAWEYLFKHWYSPDRWIIWARAIAKEIPIIHSNGIVESLWSVLKKQYLRKIGRSKLEFLISIIMNEYLPNRALLIEQHRKLGRYEKPIKPVW